MNDFGRPDDEGLLLALARGLSVRDAAATAGCSESTAWRRLRDQQFVRRLNQTRSELWSAALSGLSQAATEAVKTLVELLNSEDEGTRLKAAAKILEAGSRLRQDVEIDARLTALENTEDDHENKARAA